MTRTVNHGTPTVFATVREPPPALTRVLSCWQQYDKIVGFIAIFVVPTGRIRTNMRPTINNNYYFDY
jgi:hypothetical protein